MTLEEFRTAARDWDVSDLMHFCWDNNYEDVVEDVYSSDGYDEYIGNCLDKLEEQLIADDFFDSDEDEENECVTDDSIEEDDLVISVESVSIMYGWAI